MMRNIQELKTESDMQKVFTLAAGGETVIISNPDVVVLPREEYDLLKKANYHSKIEQAINRVQSGEVVLKTMEELEAMAR